MSSSSSFTVSNRCLSPSAAPRSSQANDDPRVFIDFDENRKLYLFFKKEFENLGLQSVLKSNDEKNRLTLKLGFSNLTITGDVSAIFGTLFGDTKVSIFSTHFTHPTDFFEIKHLNYTLDQEHATYIKNIHLLPKFDIAPPRLPYTVSDEALIESLLNQYDGFIVGESHSDTGSKEFLIDNMDQIKRLGVSRLIMEFLSKVDQELIDEYNNSPADAPMPKWLELYLHAHDQGNHLPDQYGFRALIETAKQHGIRIIAGENTISQRSNGSSFKRIPVMNYITSEIVNEEKKKEGKTIVFCGSAHCTKHSSKDFGKEEITPGLNILTGLPAVVISESTTNQYVLKGTVEARRQSISEIDILYKRVNKKKLLMTEADLEYLNLKIRGFVVDSWEEALATLPESNKAFLVWKSVSYPGMYRILFKENMRTPHLIDGKKDSIYTFLLRSTGKYVWDFIDLKPFIKGAIQKKFDSFSDCTEKTHSQLLEEEFSLLEEEGFTTLDENTALAAIDTSNKRFLVWKIDSDPGTFGVLYKEGKIPHRIHLLNGPSWATPNLLREIEDIPRILASGGGTERKSPGMIAYEERNPLKQEFEALRAAGNVIASREEALKEIQRSGKEFLIWERATAPGKHGIVFKEYPTHAFSIELALNQTFKDAISALKKQL